MDRTTTVQIVSRKMRCDGGEQFAKSSCLSAEVDSGTEADYAMRMNGENIILFGINVDSLNQSNGKVIP